MNIVIAGGRGFIGNALADALITSHQVTIISRNNQPISNKKLKLITWEDNQLPQCIADAGIVINLVGENIAAKRWSKHQKKKIIDSRVSATQTLIKLILASENKARLINASAIGVYGVPDTIGKQQSDVFTEFSTLPESPKDFLQEVGLKWEGALAPAVTQHLHLSILRFGVVLSPRGGMLKQLLPIFKLGLGGRVGSGEQPLSWVSLDDVVSFILYLIEHPAYQGVFNLVAPEVVTQKQFANTLARALHRPAILPLPSLMVKLMFGEMGELLLLGGQRVESDRLTGTGYQLRHKTLLDCLNYYIP